MELNHELATFGIAMIPLLESRAAIPAAITVFGLDPVNAFCISVLGNIFPAAVMYLFFPTIFRFLERHIGWLHARVVNKVNFLQKKYKHQYQTYGFLFLAAFVALPIPGSGVWAASLLGVTLGVRPLVGIPAIFLGLLIAALFILLATLGIVKLF